MADTKISQMTAATSLADADLVPVVQGGVNKRGTVDLILDGITAARVNTALGYTAANDAALNASNLTSGTVPDARFPATLPAASGVNLTNLVATNIATGLVPTARLGGGTASSSTYLRGDQTWATVTAGVDGSGAANVIPRWTDADSLGSSKMTASGANGGTWALYDDTATTGVTQLSLRDGAGQGNEPLIQFIPASGLRAGLEAASNYLFVRSHNGSVWGDGQIIASSFVLPSGSGRFEANVLLLPPTAQIYFNTSPALGLHSTASGLELTQGVSAAVRANLLAGDGAFFDDTPTTGSTLLVVQAGAGQSTNNLQEWQNNSGTVLGRVTSTGEMRGAGVGVETANGAIGNVQTISESITLSTSGLTTDSTADLLPANSIILAVTARVTTAITATTDWALGDATTSNRFAAANATLAAGTTAVGLRHQQGSVASDAAGPVQTTAAKLRITCTGANPGAGVIRVTVTYLSLTPPTS